MVLNIFPPFYYLRFFKGVCFPLLCLELWTLHSIISLFILLFLRSLAVCFCTHQLTRLVCALPPPQRGRLRHSADESGFGELRHAAALCAAGEQDPAALTPACCAHRSGRGCGGCEYTSKMFSRVWATSAASQSVHFKLKLLIHFFHDWFDLLPFFQKLFQKAHKHAGL